MYSVVPYIFKGFGYVLQGHSVLQRTPMLFCNTLTTQLSQKSSSISSIFFLNIDRILMDEQGLRGLSKNVHALLYRVHVEQCKFLLQSLHFWWIKISYQKCSLKLVLYDIKINPEIQNKSVNMLIFGPPKKKLHNQTEAKSFYDLELYLTCNCSALLIKYQKHLKF